MLEYERSSQCLDNCGLVSPCRGSRSPSDTSSLKEGADYSNIEDASLQLATVEPPCKQDQVCVSTLLNPPKCVAPNEAESARQGEAAQEKEYAVTAAAAEGEGEDGELPWEAEDAAGTADKGSQERHGAGSTAPPQDLRLASPLVHPEEETVTRAHASKPRTLPGLLSSYCLREFDYLCEKKKLDDFCVDDAESVVARRDLGRTAGEETPVWRCVARRKLDMSRSSACADVCGKLYVCPGGIDINKTVHAEWPQLDLVVKEKAEDSCARRSEGFADG